MKQLYHLLVSNVLCASVSGLIIVALPLYLLDLGLALDDVSYVYALGLAVNGILMYFLGSLTDTHGRLKGGLITLAGVFVAVLAFSILPLLDAILLVVVAMGAKMLLSFSETFHYNIARMRMMELATKKHMGYILGLLVFASSTGYSLGLLGGSLFADTLSLQSLLFICAGVVFMSALFYWQTGDSHVTTKAPKNILNTKGFRSVMYLEILTTAIIVLVDFFGLPIFQSEVLGLSTKQIFLSIGIAWFIYGVFSPLGGKIYDRIGSKAHIISLLLIAVTSFFLPFATTWWSFTILLTLDYVFFSIADPARHTLIAFVSGKHKGKAVSLMDMWGMIAAAAGIFLFVPLVEYLSYHALFYLRAFIHIVSILLVVRIARELRPKSALKAPVLDIHN